MSVFRIERRITFIVGQIGFAAWKISRLKILAGYFQSVIILKNISNHSSANAEHALEVMSLGSQQNQLCQLWIEGSDAELACMVLTDFINEQFELVNTTIRKKKCSNASIVDTHPAFTLPFSLDYHYVYFNPQLSPNKSDILLSICEVLGETNTEALYDSLLTREQTSSTGIGHGIAIPHIMSPLIQQPTLVVVRLQSSLKWQSTLGEVELVIATLIPQSPSRDIIIACTTLSRKLIDPDFCRLITSTTEPQALKAILLHSMKVNTQ